MSTPEPWGWLASISVSGCSDVIEHPRLLRRWLTETIRALGMTPLGEPIIMHGDTPEPGWSIVRMLQQSHIAGHFCTGSRTGYITVFSCKPFDLEDAARVAWRELRHKAESKSMTPVYTACPERCVVPERLVEERLGA